MQFGSTEREEELPEHVRIAAKVRAATTTIEGCSVELQLQKQRQEFLGERLDKVEGLLRTMIAEVQELKKIHATNLQFLLRGGPTEI